MKQILDYIVEKQEKKLFEATGLNGAKEDITIYSSKTNKEIMVKQYANSKETWKKFEWFCNQLNHHNLMKYSRIYIAKKEDNKWISDVNKNYSINDYQPNNMYLYSSKKNFYTYKQVIEMLESGEYIVVLSENKHYNR